MIAQQGIPAQAAGVNYAQRYGSGFRGLLPKRPGRGGRQQPAHQPGCRHE